jgi:hypothetical protein
MRMMRNSHRIYGGKPERRKPVGRPRHERKYNNKNDIKEIGYKGMDWINLAQVIDL